MSHRRGRSPARLSSGVSHQIMQHRTRGPALAIFLVLVAILALVATASNVIVLFGMSESVEFERLGIAPWAFYALAAIAVLRFISVVAIWFWRRSGVVLYIALTVIAIPIFLLVDQPGSLIGILGIALLLALVRDKWKDMQWP